MRHDTEEKKPQFPEAPNSQWPDDRDLFTERVEWWTKYGGLAGVALLVFLAYFTGFPAA